MLVLAIVVGSLWFQIRSQNRLISESRFREVVENIKTEPAEDGRERALRLLGPLDSSIRDWIHFTGYLLYVLLGATVVNLGCLVLVRKSDFGSVDQTRDQG